MDLHRRFLFGGVLLTKGFRAMSVEEEIAAAIRERSDAFESLFAAGDAKALVAAYYVADEDEPLLSVPDAPLIHGAAGIEAAFGGILQAFSACKLENVEIHAWGDAAHELGRADLTGRDGSSPTARYSILWRKTAAGWRVQSDFFAFGDLR